MITKIHSAQYNVNDFLFQVRSELSVILYAAKMRFVFCAVKHRSHHTMVVWEINVPFQDKNGLYRRQGLRWLLTDFIAFLFSDDPKWKKIGEAYYWPAYT